MNCIAVAVAVLAACPVMADPDRAHLLVGSDHIGAAAGFNEFNPGLFLSWETHWGAWSAGAFVNSYGAASVAGFASLSLAGGPGWDVSLFAGAAHYPGDGRRFAVHAGDWVPLGGLQVRADPFFVQVMPSDGRAVDAVLAMGLTWAID
jgi:hypothetical protein